MKIYISADMEGATGVTSWEDVTSGTTSYKRFRKLLTGDINAACKGALKAGADEILVNDAHRDMKNILLEELHSEAQLISGSEGKELCMMEGVSYSADAAFLVGYHSKAGTSDGVLHHSLSSYAHNFRINGITVGEGGISAAIAGEFGVPVILVTGDDKVCAEVKELVSKTQTAVVKHGLSRYTALCYPPAKTGAIIENAAYNAVKNLGHAQPFKIEKPVKFEIEFTSVEIAALASTVLKVERTEPRTITHKAESMLTGFKTIWSTLQLCTQAETRQGR